MFGSHLSEHTVLVGAVRDQLLRYGIELFVAHDTIEHDKLWQDEIEKALDRAHAGLVFVHQGLRESAWCDQEIGWLQGLRCGQRAELDQVARWSSVLIKGAYTIRVV